MIGLGEGDELVALAHEVESFASSARRRLRRVRKTNDTAPGKGLDLALFLASHFARHVRALAGERFMFSPLTPFTCGSCGVRALPGVPRCPRCGEERDRDRS